MPRRFDAIRFVMHIDTALLIRGAILHCFRMRLNSELQYAISLPVLVGEGKKFGGAQQEWRKRINHGEYGGHGEIR